MKDSLPAIANTWLQLLLQRVAQPVIRLRGQLLFHVGSGRFGQLFPLINEKNYFKTAFCIYSGYLQPYSDWISFTRVDGVMFIYHWPIHTGIRNFTKTTRSGRSNSIYAPPSPPCRHVHATSIALLIKLWLDSVCNRHLPKANRSFVPLTSAFALHFDLNGMHCHMQKTFKVCHRLVPPPRTQLYASSSVEKMWKTTFK